MCEVVPWWWLTFLTIVLSGAFGGVARYCWETSEGNGKEGLLPYVVMGVAASFLVPLFLNTISSSLIFDLQKEQGKFFILIGFCVAAGSFAKQFIGSVAKKALELSRQANQTALQAQETAKVAESDARSADNRAIAVYTVLSLVEQNKISDALLEVDRVLAGDPSNAEAWAWKGYCLKRTGQPAEAVRSIERALKEERREVHAWLYNLACYQCLASVDTASILATLRRAYASAPEGQKSQLKSDLQSDEDFDRIRNEPEFSSFVTSL